MNQAATNAFKALRKSGYFARRNFACCQICGCAQIPEKAQDKYVFYHGQDADDLKDRGECYLARNGNGTEIVDILIANGLKAEWDGSSATRIKMLVPA